MNRDGEHLACRFDAYCKRLLKHEVIDAIRQQKRLGQWETTFSELTRAEQGQLQYIDQYAPDRRVFPLLGMEIEVLDADLVRALSTLPTDRRAIILLFSKCGTKKSGPSWACPGLPSSAAGQVPWICYERYWRNDHEQKEQTQQAPLSAPAPRYHPGRYAGRA